MFDFSPISKNTAVLEIIILLLIAAIIGFFIAWFYWRQRYRKLEGEFSDYRTKAEGTEAELRGEIKDLKGQLEQTQGELKTTQEKLHELRMVQIQLDTLETKHKNLSQDHEALQKEYQQATSQITGLELKVKELGGVAESRRLELENRQLELSIMLNHLEALQRELESAREENAKLESALKACRNQDEEGETIVLEESVAISDGTTTIEETIRVEEKIPAGEKKDKKEILEDLRNMRHLMNFELIGEAKSDDKDDLKIIKGIGPFIEQKLNALGIYTFLQISRFDDQMIEKVTKAVGAFPGRIQRDDWMGQAAALAMVTGEEE